MRGAYRFNVMKYATRAGRKDDIILELDKIIQYAERWKQFEQSLRKQDGFDRMLQFKQRYYDGQQIAMYVDEAVQDSDTCRLTLDGVPAYINPLNFIVCTDQPVCYSKKQLMKFFNTCSNDKFVNLEISIKKQKGQEINLLINIMAAFGAGKSSLVKILGEDLNAKNIWKTRMLFRF